MNTDDLDRLEALAKKADRYYLSRVDVSCGELLNLIALARVGIALLNLADLEQAEEDTLEFVREAAALKDAQHGAGLGMSETGGVRP